MLDKYVTLKPLSLVIRMVINKKPKNPIKPTVGWAFLKKTGFFGTLFATQISKNQ
jgi:hypothetical protein